jgi:predicted DNA-binding protein (MmcQ/YjbR family)
MNIEELREYCLSRKGATECFPFDEVTLVFKVQGKMFALIPLDEPEPQIALKCDPEKALQLRDAYSAITPAFHFNKKYWNSVRMDATISHDLIKDLINHSYAEVVSKLPRKLKDELCGL